MERVRQEVEKAKKDADKAKKECESIIDEERKTMGKEMERVRNELVKEKKKVDSLTKTKRMSKGDMQEELVVLQLKNQVCVWVILCQINTTNGWPPSDLDETWCVGNIW